MTLQERARANPWGNATDGGLRQFERRPGGIVVGLSLNF
jgi:hypothetical protein